jgi:hypothetical protein
LFEIARNSAPKLNYAKFYNALFYIQEEYWSRSIPSMLSDTSGYADILFKIRSGARPEWKLLKWVKARSDTTLIHGPRYLGEVNKIKGKPSILFPTRLWRKFPH